MRHDKFLNRICFDVDERDAGSGSIFDIFSMDFEGDSTIGTDTEPKAEPQASLPEATTETATTDSTSAINSSVEPSATEEGQTPSEEEPTKVEPKKEEEVPSSPAAPSSDALLADAMKAIANLTQKKEEPKEKAVEEDDEDTKVFKPREFSDYTFNISPKLYNGLFSPDVSEEERVYALQGFASGIATTVHNRVLETLGAWTKEQIQSIPGAVNYLIAARERSQNSVKTIRDDFYGSFPELNKPELAPLVKATIQSIQKETKATTWTPQIKNLVGNRVKSVLAAYAQAAGGVKQVAPKVTKVSASPAPSVPNKIDPNSTDAILDVLNNDF